MGLLNRIRGRKEKETPLELPIHIGNVDYLVCGESAYRGDLIVTSGVLYYFPHTDLIQKITDFQTQVFAGPASLFHAGGGLRLLGITDSSQELGKSDSSQEVESCDLRIAGCSDADVKKRLDSFFSNLKSKRQQGTFNTSLPLPMRFAREEAKNCSYNKGILRFESSYDQHGFWSAYGDHKKQLYKAAKTAGFLTE